ncbi:MAG TPA: c-type cytochrome domain-containing protein, partial [Planctomycetaceae bacterium]|nr:c-type cytochrome domain-containing protein [Planctomycetaceae bacterium]
MRTRCARVVTWCALGSAMLVPVMAFGADEPVQFNRDIRPILSENCFQCHGPDKNQRKAELRLDVRDEALAKEAFVPGKPADSELIARIISTDANEIMPPTKSNKHLSPAQKELLRRWVAEGAKYEGHWAYIPPVKLVMPAGENAIDVIVAKDLAKH